MGGGIFDMAGDVVTVVADIDDALARDQASTSLERWVHELGG